MPETPSAAAKDERSRSALDFIHRLLAASEADQPDLNTLLDGLADAFAASRAGLARLDDGWLLARRSIAGSASSRGFWEDAAQRDQVRKGETAQTVPLPDGGSALATALPLHDSGWLLWLEDDRRSAWSAAEAAALTLAGLALSRSPEASLLSANWAGRLRRDACQERLEAAGPTVARIAHDYGNILTSVMGFVELSLAQALPAHSSVGNYLREVYRAAQAGAELTKALRVFSRRSSHGAQKPCRLETILTEEAARVQSADGALEVRLSVPDGLPQVAIEADDLRQALAALLDNAREAVNGRGTLLVSAATVELATADAARYLGDARSGTHVEVLIRDSGPGLSDEARRLLWSEPFYSSRSRRRGFGLATTFGVVRACRGGLWLTDGPGGGAEAHLILPVVSLPRATTQGLPAPSVPRGEKVLVVDDDPLILKLVRTTLERAGYRVEAVPGAEEALACYAAASEPFGLVVSDVVMPRVNGWDLARGLLSRDADARVLFMSGQVGADAAARGLAGRFELLFKPFRPEALLRAVRSALEHGPAHRRVASHRANEDTSVAS
jgi:signal transduction histidine kinase/FixJ family two-component response regulator